MKGKGNGKCDGLEDLIGFLLVYVKTVEGLSNIRYE